MTSHLFAGRYEPLHVLGRGGFGTVWLAHDHNLNREVALKLFQPGSDVIHAYYEAQLLTALESPHILQVLNADVYQDVPYLATRVAALRSAEDQMGPQGVRPDLAVRWTRDMLVGLHACHGRGLIHRDVKPSNLFLQNEDLGLVGDLGVAHPVDATGSVPAHGDPRIRSPEMMTSGKGDLRSDVYSAGVTLYALLAGRYPFEGAPSDLQKAIVSGECPSLRDLAPHLPRRLADRVKKAMALNPVDRFESAEAMANALVTPSPFKRVWERIPAHSGHYCCWEEVRTRGTRLQVCVVAGASPRFTIETRRSSGAQTRLRDYCRLASNESALRVTLRDIFDHV